MDADHKIFAALETFRIELPSWGFANTGTRFGKFIQPAAATTTEEKFSDAGQVHQLTGVCPTVALHVYGIVPTAFAAPTTSRSLPTVTASCPARSIPIFSRTRSISTDLSAIPTRGVRQRRVAAYQRQHRDRATFAQPGYLDVVCGWIELSRLGKYPPTEGMVQGRSEKIA